MKKPNIVFILADQWRKQATGFNGDPNVKTPNLDNLAKESINLTNAISQCPVCTPYRASFLTGQYPLTTGLFTNDVPINPKTVGLGDAFKSGGYETAYIGKWHVDGHGRKDFIPKERRKGFDYWKVLESTHQYNNSPYYDGDCEEMKYWEGYDAIAQTADACNYIKNYDKENPFIMVLSYGPPHDQNVVPPEKDDWYFGAPEKYREMYDADKLEVRPNLDKKELDARKKIEGYYAHCSALDDCIGDVLNTIKDKGIEEDTIFVFTSDHGDMLGSHGKGQKRFPWEESICVPFLLRYPQNFGNNGIKSETLIGAADIMPTLLGLADVAIPESVEGNNLANKISNKITDDNDAILIASYASGGYYASAGGRDYRGVRTKQYTYTRDLNGPWLLFDNKKDPYQMNNLINSAEYADVQNNLESLLLNKLKEQNDDFLTTDEVMKKYGYAK